jgi:hypothetical protein
MTMGAADTAAADDARQVRSDIASDKPRGVHDRLVLLPPSALIPHPENPRKHSKSQIRGIAKSIEKTGYTSPIIVDKNMRIGMDDVGD